MRDKVIAEIMDGGISYASMSDEEFDGFAASRADAFSEDERERQYQFAFLWAIRLWARSGFPRVALGHKHAAALMATNVPRGVLDDVRAPWGVFMIDVPTGILSENGIEVLHALLLVQEGLVSLFYGGSSDMRFSVQTASLDRLGWKDEANPIRTFVCRLVHGVCLEMTARRPSSSPSGIKRNNRGEPVCWTYVLGRDVKVDCRAAIRECCERANAKDADDEEKILDIQTLVRGHWKHQACGPGRMDRELIFIEPYWRGPDDVPIQIRSHEMVNSVHEQTDA